MAPSLRRPRPFSGDGNNSSSSHHIMDDDSNNNNNNDSNENNNMLLMEKKLLTLSALEAQREDKRRRMEEVFQQVTCLQMEMKELEVELGKMDHDIEQMEIDIQKDASASASSTASASTTLAKAQTAVAVTTTITSASSSLSALSTSNNNNNNIIMSPTNAATAAATQTQMDEILTDPAAGETDATMMTMTMPMTRISSQEQLTEPTERSPAITGMMMRPASTATAAVASSSSLLQPPQHHNPLSLSSCRPVALVRQLQLTTTTTTTAAAATALSRKKPPPQPASFSSFPPATAATAPSHHQALATTTNTTASLQQQQSASAAAAASAAVSSFSHDRFPWSQKVYDLLKNTFRIKSFRDYQKEIINATLSGQDVFVLMRTGGGKSLTYQLPALFEGRFTLSKKVTLVVSPLLSLIQDQEEQMNTFMPGSAISFTSGIPGGNTEQARRWGLVRDASKGVCLIFVTPEKVHKSNKLRNELQKLHDMNRLGRFVIDEAHCASQWGSDFRPDYAQLGILKRHFPSIPILAVTATASQQVRNDVCRILGLCCSPSSSSSSSSQGGSGRAGTIGATAAATVGRPYCFFRSTAHRPNLTYSVRSKVDGKDAVITDMVTFIKQHHSRNAGIVYTLSRKDANVVASQLCDYGVSARAYHSDVSPTQKQAIHTSWMKNKTQVVVATIAFGLGINKPDVRFVFHHTISKTLEAYYQESGRAGRDGLPADCILYYSPKDVIRLRAMVHEQQRGEENLWPMIRYAQAHGNDAVCKAIVLDNLGEPNAPNPTEVQRENDGVTTKMRNVGTHGQTVTRVLHEKCQAGDDLTMVMLVKLWRAKPDADTTLPCVQENPPAKDNLSMDDCERIIMALLVEQVFTFYVHWTAYQAVCYLRLGQRGHALLQSTQPKILVRFPKKQQSTKENAAATESAARKAVPTSGEWLQVKPKAKRKKPTAAATAAASKKKKAATSNKRAQKGKEQKKATTQKQIKSTAAAAAAAKKKPLHQQKLTDKCHASEIIELSSDDDDDDDDDTVENNHQQQQDDDLDHSPAKKRARGSNTTLAAVAAAAAAKTDDVLWGDDDESSSASEFEFTD